MGVGFKAKNTSGFIHFTLSSAVKTIGKRGQLLRSTTPGEAKMRFSSTERTRILSDCLQMILFELHPNTLYSFF